MLVRQFQFFLLGYRLGFAQMDHSIEDGTSQFFDFRNLLVIFLSYVPSSLSPMSAAVIAILDRSVVSANERRR